MNDKAKLKQCQADIAKITAERDGLQEELDKTKLRSWDYGVLNPASDGDFRFFLQQDGKIKAYTPSGRVGAHDAEICRDIYTISGNLKDDLERNSKDLEEFEMKDYSGTSGVEVETHHHQIYITVEHGNARACAGFDIKQAIEFHQQFGQTIFTEIRRQNAK